MIRRVGRLGVWLGLGVTLLLLRFNSAVVRWSADQANNLSTCAGILSAWFGDKAPVRVKGCFPIDYPY